MLSEFLDHFSNALLPYYFYIKFFHFFAIFAWMAGLFYLPRIFVYHAQSQDEAVKKTLDVMAFKLYSIIMTPAMLASLFFGFLLLILPHNRLAGWLHLKITCVFALVVFQFYLNRCRLDLLQRTSRKSSSFFRFINEFPTIALIIILICAIFKPF